MELLRSAIDYVEDCYTRWGQDPGYVSLFAEWRDRVADVVQRRGQAVPLSGQADRGPGQSTPGVEGVADLDGTAATDVYGGQDMAMNMFGGWDFEEFWKMMDMDLTVG